MKYNKDSDKRSTEVNNMYNIQYQQDKIVVNYAHPRASEISSTPSGAFSHAFDNNDQQMRKRVLTQLEQKEFIGSIQFPFGLKSKKRQDLDFTNNRDTYRK